MKKNLVLITLVAGVILAGVFLSFHLHQETKEKVLSQYNEHQLLIARQTARQIESYLHARSQDVRYLSSFPSLRHLDAKTMQSDVQANFNRLKTVHIKEIFVLDARGKVVYSTIGNAIGSHTTRSDIYAWAKKPVNKGMVRLAMEKSDQQGATATGEGGKPPSPRLSLVTSLYQESVAGGSPGTGDKFAGILLLTVDLEKMLADWTLVSTPTKELYSLRIWVVDEDGTLLLQSEHPAMVLRNIREKNRECNRCHVSFDYVEKIVTAKQGTVEYQLKGGQRKVAAFAPMTFEDVSWVVVVNAPYDEVTGFILGNLKKTTGLLGIVVLALGLASYFLQRSYRQKVSAQEEVTHLREKQGLMESLRETRDYLENLLEYANALVIVWDPASRITRFNRAFEHMTGYAADEVIGRELNLLFPEASRGESLGKISRTLGGEHWESVEIPILRKDGAVRVALWNSANVHAADGATVVATIAQGQDITERKKVEEEIRSSEERFRLLFDSAMDGILLVDMENRKFKMGNRTICTMLGYSREEIPHLGITNIHPEEDLPHVIDEFERQARGELFVSPEIPMRRKDGSVFHADISSTQIIFGDRRYLVGYFRDVTRERTLEKQVRTSQRMESVGTLAGGIAHDFNNMLTGILGYGELLRPRIAGDPNALADLDEILRAAERAATLTRQLLTFARRQVVELVNLDLRDVVKDLMRFFAKVAGEQIEVKTFLAEDTPTVRADRGQIEQVLMNLIVNARDAMAGGGQLLVETGIVILEEEYIQEHQYMKKGRYALLGISDTGIGMDEATRERVFDPFFTTKSPGKGTGLGLAVVYGIVKQHNGFIHLYSEPGKGSTFKVYFPAIETPPDVKIPVKAEPILGGSETILLVEDEGSIRMLAERILKEIGYTVLTACNGEEAIDLFRRHREIIALAVLDVVMPRMGGKEAYEVMRKENPGLKAIFMSGYSGNAIHEAFVIKPDTPFLGKPFAPTVLLRKVREVLDVE